MRFCLITTFFPPHHFGGDGVFVAHLANALADDGHEVEVIHCLDSFRLTQGGVPPSPMEIHPRVRIHTLESRWGAASPLLTFATGLPLLKREKLKKILSRNFDVIHWHNVSLAGGPGALHFGTGVKLCTLHEYWFTCPTHILFRNREQACTERTCFTCQLAYRRPPQLWRYTSLMRNGARAIDRFLAPGRFVQNVFRNAPEPIESTVLPHFVAFAKQPDRPSAEERSYYLYVGRLEKAKGLHTVIPLFANTKRRLVIAGAGTEEAELRRLANHSSSVEFRGRVSHSELPSLYRGAIATIVPSICYETFGLVIAESLQHRTPVIASNFGALPEMVEATGGGKVYRNIEELENLLGNFEREPEIAGNLGQVGSEHLAEFSSRKHLDHYYRIIDDIRN